MPRLFFHILFLIFVLALAAPAQKPKTKKGPSQAKPLVSQIEEPIQPPQIKDFAFVIRVFADGSTTLSVQKEESSPYLPPEKLSEFLRSYAATSSSRRDIDGSQKLEPILIVEPDPAVKLDDVVNIVKAAQGSFDSKIKIAFGTKRYLFVPKLPNPKVNLKPNPLTLVLRLDPNSTLWLNNENFGKADDLRSLKTRLQLIFNERANNGVLREGSHLVETMISIEVPVSSRFFELARLASMVEDAGSTLVVFHVDAIQK